jgi:Fe-S cluster biogenesis protein NfuA
MFIQTQETPNPESLMFIPGRTVIGDNEPLSFDTNDLCESSPFARRLLSTEGVENVFFGADFITITKNHARDWFVLKPHILGIIMEHFVNDLPVIISHRQETGSDTESSDPIFKQIQEIIDTRVRPAVANDGGDIVLHSFVDGIVYLKMKGACSGCPSSTVTLKSGIENMLKFYVPEVIEVQQIND